MSDTMKAIGPAQREKKLKTYWISFKQNFTDASEGHTLKEAVERLGMTLSDVKESKVMTNP